MDRQTKTLFLNTFLECWSDIEWKFIKNSKSTIYTITILPSHLRGVVGRVPAFQPGGQDSIPGGVRNFSFYSGIGCVSFISVLSCVVSGGDPGIVLTTHFREARPCVSV